MPTIYFQWFNITIESLLDGDLASFVSELDGSRWNYNQVNLRAINSGLSWNKMYVGLVIVHKLFDMGTKYENCLNKLIQTRIIRTNCVSFQSRLIKVSIRFLLLKADILYSKHSYPGTI